MYALRRLAQWLVEKNEIFLESGGLLSSSAGGETGCFLLATEAFYRGLSCLPTDQCTFIKPSYAKKSVILGSGAHQISV
jgi:hypothetical protein